MAAPVITPKTPAEWEQYVHSFESQEQFYAAFKDGSFTAAQQGYIHAQNATVEDLQAMARESAQLAVHDLLKRNGADAGNAKSRLDLVDRARQNSAATQALYSDRAPAAGLNGVFPGIGDYFQAALNSDRTRMREGEDRDRLDTLVTYSRAYSEKVPSEGGLLVPEEFRSDIITAALPFTLVRSGGATVVPMPTGKMRWPAVDQTTEVGEIYGGIVFRWVDEQEEITPTSASFAKIDLEAHKLAGAAVVPRELTNSPGTLTAWLMGQLPKAYAHFEDNALLKGDGVAKPFGALRAASPPLIVVSKEALQPAATFTWNNALAMFARLLPENYDTAAWVITPDAIPEVYSMAVPVGTGGGPVSYGDGTLNASQTPPRSLLGLPIRVSRKTPGILGTQGDVSLVDFSMYAIGDTQTMEIAMSEHVAFFNDRTGFRVVGQLDGQWTLLSPLTPENNGPTLSCVVQLETRA